MSRLHELKTTDNATAKEIIASINERGNGGMTREHTSKTKVRTWKANLKV